MNRIKKVDKLKKQAGDILLIQDSKKYLKEYIKVINKYWDIIKQDLKKFGRIIKLKNMDLHDNSATIFFKINNIIYQCIINPGENYIAIYYVDKEIDYKGDQAYHPMYINLYFERDIKLPKPKKFNNGNFVKYINNIYQIRRFRYSGEVYCDLFDSFTNKYIVTVNESDIEKLQGGI